MWNIIVNTTLVGGQATLIAKTSAASDEEVDDPSHKRLI